MLNKLKLIILTGPSGSGKTTLRNKLLEYNPKIFKKIKTYTTREPRSTNDLTDYHFITNEEFKIKSMNQEFVEWQQVYPNCFYGTAYTELYNIVDYSPYYVLCLDVRGAQLYKNKLKDKVTIETFFCDPGSIKVTTDRLKSRGKITNLTERIKKYTLEMKYKLVFDFIIETNLDINLSLLQILNNLSININKLED